MTAPAKKTTARKTVAKKTTAAKPTPPPPVEPDTEDAIPPQPPEQATEPTFEEKWVEAEERAGAMTELAEARSERIALLEQQIADLTTSASPSPAQVEVFVKEGAGRCLDCSCEQWVSMPPEENGATPTRCWGCNHDLGQHKRNPAGAVFKDAD